MWLAYEHIIVTNNTINRIRILAEIQQGYVHFIAIDTGNNTNQVY